MTLLSHRSSAGLLSVIVVTLAVLLDGRPATAQVWVDVRDLDGKLPDWVDERYVRPAPATEKRTPSYRRVWVEPVYRIVSRRVWVEPVVRVVYEHVDVPPRYEIRETVCWEDGVKVIRRERICVDPGGYRTVRREIVERPGHWKWIESRDLISGGYWKLEPA